MKYYVGDLNGILSPLKEKVKDKLATPRDADVWVTFQDVLGSYGDLIKTAKSLGVAPKVYTVQHGRGSTTDYDKPNSFPLSADRYLCWGSADYERLVRLGYGDRANIVGCPLNVYIRPKVEHKEKVVLFVPVNTGKEEPENIAAYYELLKLKYEKAQIVVLDNRNQLKDTWGFNDKHKVSFNELAVTFDVVTKLLPWHDQALYHGQTIVGYQDMDRNNKLVFNLLRNVDLVVGMDEGTTEIFAYGHDVPVVIVDGFRYRQHKPNGTDYELIEPYKTEAAVHTDLAGLKDAVNHALAHPEHLREERKAVAERELGISYGDATANILKLIKNDFKA